MSLSVLQTEKAKDKSEIISDLKQPDELHLLKLLAAIAKGFSYQELHEIVHIHPVYFQKLFHIVEIGHKLVNEHLTDELLIEAKKRGFVIF
ncbi:hypothetical protein SDC49_15555 [Lactobacillus sp. R2/2]|nr:hypothetical protein [Lactobacillus sp. R2/2]